MESVGLDVHHLSFRSLSAIKLGDLRIGLSNLAHEPRRLSSNESHSSRSQCRFFLFHCPSADRTGAVEPRAGKIVAPYPHCGVRGPSILYSSFPISLCDLHPRNTNT